ncbi:MAG: hypothetical protein JWO05_2386 [Gemmatimonadetes bacterium]|nr:hypothetical protein [Gemmatimonadota bacterium]
MRPTRMLTTTFAVALLAATAAHAQSASSICKDGSPSGTVGRGACSGHGGVDAKATSKAQKAATKAASKAQKDAAREAKKDAKNAEKVERKEEKVAERNATVRCTDGTTSNGGRGACSGHGGISRAPTPAPRPMPMPQAAPRARERASERNPVSNATGGSGSREDNDSRGAIARCKDGLYSHAAHRQGACSTHGGVASWIGQ